MHNGGKGARYTKSRTPFVLYKSFGPMTKSEALKLEYKIKRLPRKEKVNFTINK
jgi:putative endonuclease